MIKDIYMSKPGGNINQCLVNLVIDEQLPDWDKNDLVDYKAMYLISKTWLFLEF